MSAVRPFTPLVAALALLFCVTALRRLLFRRASAKTLVSELLGPQRLFAGYLLARGSWLVLQKLDFSGRPLLHGLEAAALFLGAVSVMRLLDALAFAFVRWRGGRGIPRILRSLLEWAVTFIAAAAVLRSEYKLDLSSLIATSALLSVVLGFALQETLGNLFAGLTLHAERPFEQGEWVSFGAYSGRVLDVGWRSTRLITGDERELLVPNSLISREVVVNHSRPLFSDCVEVDLQVDLEVAPARAKAAIFEALQACTLAQGEPAPTVELASFGASASVYRVRFFTESYPLRRRALDQLQEAVWYALRRAAIEMPVPQTMLSFRERPAEAEERRRREHLAEAQELLGRIDFVQMLSAESQQQLAQSARFLEYGAGQSVVRQGDNGETFYLVSRGELAVRIRVEGGEKEVARLNHGAFFGEMSLLTGEPRTASVVALGDAALMAVGREAFSLIFRREPDAALQLAEVIAGRRLALESARAEGPAQSTERETSNLLGRIRKIFGFRARGPDKAAG